MRMYICEEGFPNPDIDCVGFCALLWLYFLFLPLLEVLQGIETVSKTSSSWKMSVFQSTILKRGPYRVLQGSII